MSWMLLLGILWVLVAVVVALAIGRSIALRDGAEAPHDPVPPSADAGRPAGSARPGRRASGDRLRGRRHHAVLPPRRPTR